MPLLLQYYDQLPLPSPGKPRLELLRNRAIVHVLLSTGVRVMELISLTRDQVADGAVSEVQVLGKRKRSRTIYLDQEACEAIQAYCKERDDDCPALFVSHRGKVRRLGYSGVYNIVRAAAEDCGLARGTSPHMFRHWFATDMAESDVPVEILQQLLGHARIETTLIYAKISKRRVRDHVRRYRARRRMQNGDQHAAKK
jgi:site-specific recombinase XerD